MIDDPKFWSKVDKNTDSGCWIWTGRTVWHGYGQLQRRGRMIAAHRWAYTLLRGEIPSGLTLDHLCYTPPCVNPYHLEPVTQSENSRRIRANRYNRVGDDRTDWARISQIFPELAGS